MIKKATINQAREIASIYESARQYMLQNGFEQWRAGYPSVEDVKNDINNGVCHILTDGDTIYGAFTMMCWDDPTYAVIEDGHWLDDSEYIAIHRVASNGKKRGVFKEIIDYAKKKSNHLRIDTHKENKNMQRLITQNGFEYCGIIHLLNGDPRLAYEYIQK